jgi:hypothetical protein
VLFLKKISWKKLKNLLTNSTECAIIKIPTEDRVSKVVKPLQTSLWKPPWGWGSKSRSFVSNCFNRVFSASASRHRKKVEKKEKKYLTNTVLCGIIKVQKRSRKATAKSRSPRERCKTFPFQFRLIASTPRCVGLGDTNVNQSCFAEEMTDYAYYKAPLLVVNCDSP